MEHKKVITEFEYVELLEVAVAVGCPNDCLRYCPQEVVLKAWGNRERFMSFEDYKKIIFTLPQNVYIDFAGLTEPFSNPDFLAMAKYTRDQGYEFGVKTTLVGASVEDVKRLAKLKPCCVFLHLPDGVNFVAPENNEYGEVLVAGLKYFRNAQLSLMNDLFYTNSREKIARGQAKNHCGSGWCYRREHPQMVVFPDGSTVFCCIDMRLEHVVGNLLREHYSVLRKRFLSQKSISLCSECSYNVAFWRFYLRKILRNPRVTLGKTLPLWIENP